MAVIKVQTNVVGFQFQVETWLEGKRIALSNNGSDKWQSTDVLEVNDGKLSIIFHCQGMAGSAWTFSLTQLPGGKEIYKNQGENAANGHSLFTDFVEIKEGN